jgi:large conductance mechanosensitive channel
MSDDIFEKLLENVRVIRESVEPKTDQPASPAPKGFLPEFKAFLQKYSVIGLAIAVIIGGAAGRLVSSLVSDILMPIITFFLPGGAWREATLTIGPIELLVGSFFAATLDFLIIAIVVFLVMKQLERSPVK